MGYCQHVATCCNTPREKKHIDNIWIWHQASCCNMSSQHSATCRRHVLKTFFSSLQTARLRTTFPATLSNWYNDLTSEYACLHCFYAWLSVVIENCARCQLSTVIDKLSTRLFFKIFSKIPADSWQEQSTNPSKTQTWVLVGSSHTSDKQQYTTNKVFMIACTFSPISL